MEKHVSNICNDEFDSFASYVTGCGSDAIGVPLRNVNVEYTNGAYPVIDGWELSAAIGDVVEDIGGYGP